MPVVNSQVVGGRLRAPKGVLRGNALYALLAFYICALN